MKKMCENINRCKNKAILIVIFSLIFAGCGGGSGEDLFDKTVPQNQKRDFMFVVTEWQCEYCGEIIVQSSYGNGDAYGYPPLKDCKRNPGFAHSYVMTRWKSYDWDSTANTWKYGRGEDRRKKEETRPKAEQSTATVATESKPTSSAKPSTSKQERNDSVAKNSVSNNTSLDEHWFTDIKQGVLIWNPNPESGESVEWTGGFIQDGTYKYADGHGEAKWYLNGSFEQLDEGNYEHGKRHGRFKQEFSDGRVVYSEWQHGTKVH
ncbi:MAG: hypothetical protein J5477_06380 [Schwartzia sp.]|nr:hypothetical protein [Schwartzia sp. (in: firmicutes)]